MVDRSTRESLFEHVRRAGARASWCIDGECLWSYFFEGDDEETLFDACEPLEEEGFDIVNVSGGPEPEEPGRPFWIRLDRKKPTR